MNPVIRITLLFCSLIFINIGNEQTLQGQELSMFQRGLFSEFYEDDVKLSRADFVLKMKSIPESAMHWKKYQTSNTISVLSGVGSLGAFAWWISKEEGQNDTAPLIATLGTSILGAIFSKKAFNHRREALLSYNRSTAVGTYVAPSSKGIGIALHF